MHFVKHFTHVSRHFRVYCRKQKQKKVFRENCFEKVVSDVNKKWFKSPQNYFQKKVQKLKKIKKQKKNENVHNLWWILGTKLLLLVDSLDQIFKTVFSEDFLLFSTLNSKMSRNMRKMLHKVRNDQNLPHESPNFTKKKVK